MGVIFFSTLIAVALGYGLRSKIRKNTERRETTPLPQPDFLENGLPVSEVMPFDSGEAFFDGSEEIPEDGFPVQDEAFFTSGLAFEGDIEPEIWKEEEEKVETDEKGKAGSAEKEEAVLSQKGNGEESDRCGISLREAIIAQAVLERKYP